MDAQRVRPMQNSNAAAEQVKAMLDRSSPEEAVVVPLFVFDAGYDPVRVQQGLEGRRCQILVRLRAGRCFYADPTEPPAPTGRSRRHGRNVASDYQEVLQGALNARFWEEGLATPPTC